MSEKTVYDRERAKFEGFGNYKLPIDDSMKNGSMKKWKQPKWNILTLIIIYLVMCCGLCIRRGRIKTG